MGRRRNLRVALVVVALLVLGIAGGFFWRTWWLPKTDFSCDGWPSGQPSALAAGSRLVESIVDQDVVAACRVLTNKLGHDDVARLLAQWKAQLGNPRDASAVRVVLGEQGGSTIPLVLSGPGGRVELAALSFLDWYRVTAPA